MHGLGEAALRDAWICLDEEQYPRAPGGHFAHRCREIPEYRLLRDPQPVADELGKHAGRK